MLTNELSRLVPNAEVKGSYCDLYPPSRPLIGTIYHIKESRYLDITSSFLGCSYQAPPTVSISQSSPPPSLCLNFSSSPSPSPHQPFTFMKQPSTLSYSSAARSYPPVLPFYEMRVLTTHAFPRCASRIQQRSRKLWAYQRRRLPSHRKSEKKK